MTQAWNLSQLANKVNTSGQLDVSTGASGVLPVANGGTNNNVTPTAGGVIYGTGTAMATSAAGTSGYFLQSTGAGAPTWASLSAAGALNNVQYFTATATYTPTSGTSFVIVEVVGGGGGGSDVNISNAGSGGTTSFGALVSATGGTGGTTLTPSGGAGSSGDINLTGGTGGKVAVGSKISGACAGGFAPVYGSSHGHVTSSTAGTIAITALNYGGGGGRSGTNGNFAAGGGGGYARKKILTGFSGVTVTIGAAGTAGSGGQVGAAGLCVVWEYK